jgi:hypothetical protein
MNVYKVQTKNGSTFYLNAEDIQSACGIVESTRLFCDVIVLVQDMGENSEILYE